jgi:hypothetical protein
MGGAKGAAEASAPDGVAWHAWRRDEWVLWDE